SVLDVTPGSVLLVIQQVDDQLNACRSLRELQKCRNVNAGASTAREKIALGNTDQKECVFNIPENSKL
ncbi:hypothetical protein, partial [Comamonas thiooxydans]|uniref:hypothetical protein n=1 Tax=Comamonas thiooxydans TaxID=363952 RepID=UPI001A943861